LPCLTIWKNCANFERFHAETQPKAERPKVEAREHEPKSRRERLRREQFGIRGAPGVVDDAEPDARIDTRIDAQAWWRDPETIPPRHYLYGRHYIRGAVGATIAAGGRGKTTLATYEAVSMTAGRNLKTGEALPCQPLRVGLLNGEEDQDELDRPVAATCQCYGITESDLGGRLFVKSVRDQPIRIARMVRNAPRLNPGAVAQLDAFMRDNRLDVLMVDPLISFHSVPENDNGAMDVVIKEGFGAIVGDTNAAAELFHHPGKPKPGQAETVVEDARGASAVIWAVRSARVLNFMTPEEATKLGIAEADRRLHIRVANGKANMGPIGKAEWMKLVIENLPNGDQVACSSSWKPPDPFKGLTAADMELARHWSTTGAYRADSRSPHWLGYKLAEHLHLDVTHDGRGPEGDAKDIARIKEILSNAVELALHLIPPAAWQGFFALLKIAEDPKACFRSTTVWPRKPRLRRRPAKSAPRTMRELPKPLLSSPTGKRNCAPASCSLRRTGADLTTRKE
jgi:hypothetical protein